MTVSSAASNEPRPLAQYVHQQWHSADGLPQESVQALVKSSDGYLWVGTQDGLARYDGSRFARFQRTLPVAGTPVIYALASRADGEVWVGTAEGVYAYKRGAFTQVAPQTPLARAVTRCLLPTRGGTVLVGTAVGLFRIGGSGVEAIPADSGTLDIVALAESPSGAVAVLTNRGFRELDRGRLREPAIETPSGIWNTLTFDATGAQWIAGASGAWRVEHGRFVPVSLPSNVAGHVTGLYRDDEQNIWVATEKGVALVRDGNTATIETLAGAVRWGGSFAEDPDGGLWIGSRGYGLHRIRPGRAAVMASREGLVGDYVLGVFETRDGSVWVGSDGGVTRIRDGQLTNWTERDGLRGRQPRAFHETPDGTLWVGTERALCRLASNRFVCGVPGMDDPDVFALADDGEGGFWVGAVRGLFRVGPDGVARPGPAVREGDGADVVWTVFRTRSGTLWVAGEHQSLTRITSGTVRRYTPPEIPPGFVIAAIEDDDGTMWFGTAGRGLIRYKDDRFTVVDSSKGLHDDIVYAMVRDGLGHVWMSSNRGIHRVAYADLVAVADGRMASLAPDVIGLAEGLRSAECNGTVTHAGVRARDGRLWFPTTNGVAILDPRQSARSAPVPVVIEEVLVDQRPVPVSAERLDLPPGDGEVEFRFSLLSFSEPAGSLSVRYRLEGFDHDWRVSAGERTARYTNLAPGDYTFRVVTGTVGTPSGEREAVLPLRLRSHPYQSRAFQGAAALTVFTLAGTVVAFTTLRAKRRREELQRAVADALGKVKVLEGMLPICAWCRRVQSDEGRWEQIESYVSAHTNAAFSHGICPTCAAEMERALRAPDGSAKQ